MLYAILTVGVVAFATMIMLGMDASSRAQGGRFYIALAAIAMLLGLDKLSATGAPSVNREPAS